MEDVKKRQRKLLGLGLLGGLIIQSLGKVGDSRLSSRGLGCQEAIPSYFEWWQKPILHSSSCALVFVWLFAQNSIESCRKRLLVGLLVPGRLTQGKKGETQRCSISMFLPSLAALAPLTAAIDDPPTRIFLVCSLVACLGCLVVRQPMEIDLIGCCDFPSCPIINWLVCRPPVHGWIGYHVFWNLI